MLTRTIEIVLSPGEPHFEGNGFRRHDFNQVSAKCICDDRIRFLLLDYNSSFLNQVKNSKVLVYIRTVDFHYNRVPGNLEQFLNV